MFYHSFPIHLHNTLRLFLVEVSYNGVFGSRFIQSLVYLMRNLVCEEDFEEIVKKVQLVSNIRECKKIKYTVPWFFQSIAQQQTYYSSVLQINHLNAVSEPEIVEYTSSFTKKLSFNPWKPTNLHFFDIMFSKYRKNKPGATAMWITFDEYNLFSVVKFWWRTIEFFKFCMCFG